MEEELLEDDVELEDELELLLELEDEDEEELLDEELEELVDELLLEELLLEDDPVPPLPLVLLEDDELLLVLDELELLELEDELAPSVGVISILVVVASPVDSSTSTATSILWFPVGTSSIRTLASILGLSNRSSTVGESV